MNKLNSMSDIFCDKEIKYLMDLPTREIMQNITYSCLHAEGQFLGFSDLMPRMGIGSRIQDVLESFITNETI